MSLEISLTLLVISIIVLGCSAGTYTALEVLSYVHPDKKSDEKWWNSRYVRILSGRPLASALFLWLARGLLLISTAGLAVYTASAHLFAAAPAHTVLVVLFAAITAYAPLAVSSLFAVRSAQGVLDASKPVIYPFLLMAAPLIAFVERLIRAVGPGTADALAYRLKPLEQKIAMFGNENGYLEEEEQKLMSSIFDFGDTKVREVMVPRIDILAVNISTSKEEAMRIINEAGHSRIPVYDETIDKIVGIVYTKDLFGRIVTNEDFTLAQITRGAFFVPESKKIDELLAEFKKQKKHIAIAVDEYGGTAGLITMEDILEELVGDIQDEFDYEEELINMVDDDSALCNAKVHIDDLKDKLGIDLSGGGSDSLGGFLYEKIGRVPRVGDKVEEGKSTFEIHSVLRQRIDKVLIRGLRSDGRNAGRPD